MRKVAVITGTRAEYGLLYWIIQGIEDDLDLELQLIVTGMHLSPEFGMTINSIDESKTPITKKIETLLSSDTPIGISKSMGLGMISFCEAYHELEHRPLFSTWRSLRNFFCCICSHGNSHTCCALSWWRSYRRTN